VQEVDDGAIERSAERVRAVNGKRNTRAFLRRLKVGITFPHQFQKFGIKQVEAVSQLDHGADDGGHPYFRAAGSRMIFQGRGILQRTGRAILPEIDAFAEPIEFVAAAIKVGFAGEDPFCDGSIAAMKAQGIGGKNGIHGG